MNTDIAIIGGSGFIGTNLSNCLDDDEINYTIYDIVEPKKNQNYKYLDVVKPETFDQIDGSKCIINLAAEHKDNVLPVSKYDDVNVKGAKNICDAATQYNVNKIIFIECFHHSRLHSVNLFDTYNIYKLLKQKN